MAVTPLKLAGMPDGVQVGALNQSFQMQASPRDSTHLTPHKSPGKLDMLNSGDKSSPRNNMAHGRFFSQTANHATRTGSTTNPSVSARVSPRGGVGGEVKRRSILGGDMAMGPSGVPMDKPPMGNWLQNGPYHTASKMG